MVRPYKKTIKKTCNYSKLVSQRFKNIMYPFAINEKKPVGLSYRKLLQWCAIIHFLQRFTNIMYPFALNEKKPSTHDKGDYSRKYLRCRRTTFLWRQICHPRITIGMHNVSEWFSTLRFRKNISASD